mgnify:FL=1
MDNSRTELLLGKENIEKISKSHVTIVGTGGVGGYVALFLARAGISKFTIIDFDKITPSNINRQAVAFTDTIGLDKVKVLKDMILKINPDAQIDAVNERLCEENVVKFVKNDTFVVDAIDSVKDKVAIICYCKKNNINIISAMGAGNRFDSPSFIVVDIEKTHDDGLAKAIRKRLRELGIKGLDVAISYSKPQKFDKIIGSISYYPPACACVIASYVINKIIGK